MRDTLMSIWKFIVSIPGWVYFALLIMGGALYYYAVILDITRQRLAIKSKQAELQRKRIDELSKIDTQEKLEIAKINTVYDEKEKKLKQREQELDKLALRGPVEIAESWRKYLSK